MCVVNMHPSVQGQSCIFNYVNKLQDNKEQRRHTDPGDRGRACSVDRSHTSGGFHSASFFLCEDLHSQPHVDQSTSAKKSFQNICKRTVAL